MYIMYNRGVDNFLGRGGGGGGGGGLINKVTQKKLQLAQGGGGGICPLLHEVRKQKFSSKFKSCKRAN